MRFLTKIVKMTFYLIRSPIHVCLKRLIIMLTSVLKVAVKDLKEEIIYKFYVKNVSF